MIKLLTRAERILGLSKTLRFLCFTVYWITYEIRDVFKSATLKQFYIFMLYCTGVVKEYPSGGITV